MHTAAMIWLGQCKISARNQLKGKIIVVKTIIKATSVMVGVD